MFLGSRATLKTLRTPQFPGRSRRKRLEFLAKHLGVVVSCESRLRYQLLHRTVSVLLETALYGATASVVLVHAFGALCEENWSDFQDFMAVLGFPAVNVGSVIGPALLGESRNIPTHFLWWQDPSSIQRS